MTKEKEKPKKNWVDFKRIKEEITIAQVLEHYGVELKQSGKSHTACCPIHKGSNPKQFSVNLERNIWRCFGNCAKGGNILDLVSAMEGDISPHEAGLKLQNWFLAESKSKSKPNKQPAKTVEAKAELVREEKKEPKAINPPLRFELSNLETDHQFFKDEGIDQETVEYFGLGFCRKGIMANRIAIPIHDHQGRLIAYCGRALDEELIRTEGKYKLPSSEHGFHKSHVLYNLNRQNIPTEELILVESFKSVWWFQMLGIGNVVSPLGSSVSEEQAELLRMTLAPKNGKLDIIFDADESGREGAEKALALLGKFFYVKSIDISRFAKKPHQLTQEQVWNL